MFPFALLPTTTWIAAAAAAAFAVLAGVQTVRLSSEKTSHAMTRANFAGAQRDAAQATTRAEQAERAKENAYVKGREDAVKEALPKIDAARADARAATRAADGLRRAAADLAARSCAAGPGAKLAAGGSPAETAGALLADVLGRVEDRGRELAAYADAARIAGETCERIHDKVAPP